MMMAQSIMEELYMPSGLLSLAIDLNALEAGRGAQLLAARGLRPRLLVRRPERGPLLRRLDAELVHGDLESPERAVSGVEGVIHLGARACLFSKLGLPRQ
jgi:hypothetical protein